VASGERRADAFRLERGLLLVDGAHEGALLVVEHRRIERAGQVILREFRGTARVDDVVESADLRERERRGDRRVGAVAVEGQLRHFFFSSTGSSTAHTLSRKAGCASAFGCSWSGRKRSDRSATPARRNGTIATLCFLATSANTSRNSRA